MGSPTTWTGQGSPGTPGLSAASPWPIATAINAVNAGAGGDTIILLSSTSDYYSVTWPTITKSCRIIASGPGVRITNWYSPASTTWVAASGAAGAAGTVYSAAKSGYNGVFDLVNQTSWTDRTGRVICNYAPYVNKGTAADQAGALALLTGDGQYAFDGANIYVRPIGAMDLSNTAVCTNLRMRAAGSVGVIASGAGVVVYARGVTFEAHQDFRAQADAILIADDCSFEYKLDDATTHDGGHAIHIRCVASACDRDGFNYHDGAGNGSEFMEIDCVSGYNGVNDSNNNNNGSTSHETCRGIRVKRHGFDAASF